MHVLAAFILKITLFPFPECLLWGGGGENQNADDKIVSNLMFAIILYTKISHGFYRLGHSQKKIKNHAQQDLKIKEVHTQDTNATNIVTQM